MEIQLIEASIDQKQILRNLMELYNYDFTEFEQEDVNEFGLYGYKYIDHYWTDEDRYPFFMRVNNKWAGFVLVRKTGVNSEGINIYSIAEFFIMKKYRNAGVGKKIAIKIFDAFKGEWKVGQIENNVPAIHFWRNVISEYTKGNYDEIREDGWDGPKQRFINI